MQNLELKSKSALINQALKLYFERLDYIEMAEENRVVEQLAELRKKESKKEPAEIAKEIKEITENSPSKNVELPTEDYSEYFQDDWLEKHLSSL
ncbi:hypothetical protein KBC03_01860 [Patescibacteria group bacterium]|nr:hypothetical protein [Patescibacteria group bacterium]